MIGKELSVIEYNLTFGKGPRIVNVFGVFRYKKNNGLYVIYSDVGTQYNVVNYGSSHVKDTSILSMSCKDGDVEIIKEYIYKVTNDEKLDGFEIISLDNITGIEIISSNHLEVKSGVIQSLIEKTIPKREEVVVNKVSTDKKVKKSGLPKIIVILLVVGVIGLGGYYYFSTLHNRNTIVKTITCVKKNADRNLNASIETTNVFQFNYQDSLEMVEMNQVFKFHTESAYQDFINKGTMYRYMPEGEENGGFKQDDQNSTFSIVTRTRVDSSYTEPTNYEDVLSYYKRDGFECSEELTGE